MYLYMHVLKAHTRPVYICVAPIYKPHIVCSDGDGMHGSISPDAINFTIKYMMGGGEWPDAKPLA